MRPFLSLILTVALGLHWAEAQGGGSAEVQLKAAVHKEEVEGDLKGAIEQYQRIIDQHSANRKVAADALVRMGQCYEKLGSAEARQAYERVLKDFPDQKPAVARAQAGLAKLGAAESARRGFTLTVRRILEGRDFSSPGAVSPDGRFAAFTDWGTGDIVLHDLRTGAKRAVTHEGRASNAKAFANVLRWSPSGKEIAVEWYNKERIGELKLVNPDTGQARTLVTYPKDQGIGLEDWSPDETLIATVVGDRQKNCWIETVTAAGGDRKIVKKVRPADCPGMTMRFSPDGSHLAYDHTQKEGSPERDISLISLDGVRETRLIEHASDDRLIGWIPASRSMIFTSDRTSNKSLWRVQLGEAGPAGSPELVKESFGYVFPLGFTRNGSFFYSELKPRRDVYSALLDPVTGRVAAPPRKVSTRFEQNSAYPEYSPDGKYLAFAVLQEPARGVALLVVQSLETGQRRDLSKLVALRGPLRWSTDSRSIYLMGATPEEPTSRGIIVADVASGKTARLFSCPAETFIVSYDVSTDGRSLCYARLVLGTGPSEIVSRELASGAERVVY